MLAYGQEHGMSRPPPSWITQTNTHLHAHKPHSPLPRQPHKEPIVLAILPKHLSKTGTLILLNPQDVNFLSYEESGIYGQSFIVLKSVYISYIISLPAICSVSLCQKAGVSGAPGLKQFISRIIGLAAEYLNSHVSSPDLDHW